MKRVEWVRDLGASCLIVLLIVVGLGVIAYAGWLVTAPLGYLLGGLGLLYLALAVHKAVTGGGGK